MDSVAHCPLAKCSVLATSGRRYMLTMADHWPQCLTLTVRKEFDKSQYPACHVWDVHSTRRAVIGSKCGLIFASFAVSARVAQCHAGNLRHPLRLPAHFGASRASSPMPLFQLDHFIFCASISTTAPCFAVSAERKIVTDTVLHIAIVFCILLENTSRSSALSYCVLQSRAIEFED